MSRKNRISVYFSDEEIKELHSKYSIDPNLNERPNGRIAQYMRELILGNELPDSKINPIAIKQWQELARLSANINQLSYLNNINEYIDTSEVQLSLSKLRSTLINVEAQHES